MEGIISLYNYIMTFLVAILFVVTTALVFIIFTHLHGQRHVKQFWTEKNIEDLIYWMRYLQKWTHSTTLELIWTIIPTIILIAIAIPSFILLYSLDEIVDTQCVVKIIAYQWYWKYEYPVLDPISNDIFSFSYLSYMVPLADLTEEDNLRLLEVDTPLVLPTNVNSKLVITSKDVIHSFAVPALGIKMDAVPGRLNQVTAHIFKSGVYYGQCSELCGVNHAFMPIVINAVDFTTFENFLKEGMEISNKKFMVPYKGNSFNTPVAYYMDGLITVVKLENPEKTEEFFVTNQFFWDELVSRLLLTAMVSSNYGIDGPEVKSFLLMLVDNIILLENCAKELLPEGSPALKLNYGTYPSFVWTALIIPPFVELQGISEEILANFSNKVSENLTNAKESLSSTELPNLATEPLSEPELKLSDLSDELIMQLIDFSSFELDEEATEKLRQDVRALLASKSKADND